MSVILRNHPSTLSSSTGIEDGFPPGDVTIIGTAVNDGQVLVKWSDPEDTIINGSTISAWAGTILVRKQGSYPINLEDGTIVINNTNKNAYKDTWFKDSGLTNNTEYYYRFFTYNTDEVYNNSGDIMFSSIPLFIAPVFSDNSWDQVIAACSSDSVPDTWNVGDEIQLQLSEIYSHNVVLQIWDFDHFDKSDGTGKAHLVLGCKGIPFIAQMNTSDTNSGGWEASYMSKTIMENVYNSIPSNVRNSIKTVNIGSDTGYGGNSVTIQDKIFIPSCKEVGFSTSGLIQGTKFPIFTDNASRIKKTNNGTGSADWWWLRSSRPDISTSFYGVRNDGGLSYGATSYDGVVFCFCI